MSKRAEQWWWVAKSAMAGSLLLLSVGCSGTLVNSATSVQAVSVPTHVMQSDEDDYGQLIAQLRGDLNRFNSRESEKPAARTTATAQQTGSSNTKTAREREFADRARSLFGPLNGTGSTSALLLRMPVVGVRGSDLDDSWHAPRDGGARQHTGIDIFAPKGTEIVAVADGIISYIGDQPKGGHCLWLTTDDGPAFYYAHLDRWAAGLYEGMEVRSGDLLGYVGNTGNAIHTPSHLHFSVNQNDEMVNPYPILTKATPTSRGQVHVALSGGVATTVAGGGGR
jgi:murein DD-endopeptidase MepM/ murein hydrolase activator NlpD